MTRVTIYSIFTSTNQNNMKTYKNIETNLIANGFSTNGKIYFVNGVPTHTFTNGNKTILVIHLGLGKGYEEIEIA